MKPVEQTKFGYPDGNCMMACVASITEIPLDELPDLRTEADLVGKSWWYVSEKALAKNGWIILWHEVEVDKLIPPGWSIANGDSPRGITNKDGSPVGHSVVVFDGELKHDPHPSDSGLDGPPYSYYILIKAKE